MKNTNMKFVKYGPEDNDRHTVNNNWETGPLLCEGIPMSVRFPKSMGINKFFPLDASGNRKQTIQCAASTDDKMSVGCDPQYKTLWYEIVTE